MLVCPTFEVNGFMAMRETMEGPQRREKWHSRASGGHIDQPVYWEVTVSYLSIFCADVGSVREEGDGQGWNEQMNEKRLVATCDMHFPCSKQSTRAI